MSTAVPRAIPRRRALTAALAVITIVLACLQTASAAPVYRFAAPGDLTKTAVTSTSMQISWAPVPGAPGYKVRAYSKGNPILYFPTTDPTVKLTGLKKNTLYYVRAFVEQPAEGDTKAVTLSPNSPEPQIWTSTYSRRSPDGLKVTKQDTTSVGLAWTAVADLKPTDRYMVEYADDTVMSLARRTVGPFAGTSATLAKLPTNRTYFAKVYVVDSTGKRISGSSPDLVTVKTVVPRGTLRGKAAGASAGDLMALAYDASGELGGKASVRSDGTYSMEVRPGAYRVLIQYVGTDGFTSLWARTAGPGSLVPSQATRVTVAQDKAADAPSVTVAKGATVTGTIKNANRTAVVRDVDVTALSAVTSEREVVAVTRSGDNYKLEGLAPGRYWLRFIYSGDGFANRSVRVDVTAGQAATVNTTLENANFRSKYKPSISGTKKVGSTLSAKVTPWVAGSYPTTRARMSFQWLRNGSPISRATASKYKLTSADRGKKISVRATAQLYGYNTGSSTSTAYKVA